VLPKAASSSKRVMDTLIFFDKCLYITALAATIPIFTNNLPFLLLLHKILTLKTSLRGFSRYILLLLPVETISKTGIFFVIFRFKMLSRFFFAIALLFALLFLGAAAVPKEVLATVSLFLLIL
jgi:hypothetical protein